MRRRLAIGVGLVILALAGAAAVYVLPPRGEGKDVRGSSTVEFVTTQRAPPKPKEPGIAWPMWGHDAERLRVASGISLAPPFRRAWTFRARSLVEFPPAVAYGRLY